MIDNDSKMTEERARDMLYDAFEAIDQGLALYDHELRFVMYNHRFIKSTYSALGIQPPIAGEHFAEHALRLAKANLVKLPFGVTPELYAEYIVDAVERYTKNIEIPMNNGGIFHGSAHRTKLGGCLITITDITDRKRAESAEYETELANTRFTEALEAFDEGFVLWDSDLRLVLKNQRMQDMLYPEIASRPAVHQGDTFQAILREQIADGLYGLPENIQTERAITLWTRLIKSQAKGQEIELGDGRILVISSHKTSIGGYLLTLKDVTDRRRAERIERENADLLRNIVEACPANFLMTRIEDGKVLYQSPSSKQLTGEKTTSHSLWKNPEDRVTYIETLERDGQVNEMFHYGYRGDGTVFPCAASARLIDYQGEKVSVSSTIDLTEVMAQREELEELNTRLTAVLNSLDVGLVFRDADLRFVMANKSMHEMFYSRIDPPQPGESIAEITQRQLQAGIFKQGDEKAVMTQDMITTYAKGFRVALADGRIVIGSSHETGIDGYLQTFTDVTNEIRAEENKLAAVYEATQALDEGIALYDPNLNFVFGNKKLDEFFYSGTVPSPQIGDCVIKSMQQLMDDGFYKIPDSLTQTAFLDKMVDSLKSYAKNTIIEASSGLVLETSIHETELSGYLIVFRDVTAQRRAEQAEREANLLLKVIVEASPTTFLVSRVDDGKIIYFPPASRDRYGDIESTLELFLGPENREAYLNALIPTGLLNDYPVQFLRSDGSVMQGLTSSRVTDYKGQDVIVSSTRDISDQLAMQAELEAQKNIAHQNEKLSALGELLAGVAHELNNPLSIVVGYALMMQDKIEDPKQKQRIERIGQAAERCAKIVKMFLAMARQRPTRIDNCCLNDTLLTALDVAGYGLKSAGAKIELKLDPKLPLVAADPDQIAQVFTNLIVNAEHALRNLGEKARLDLISSFDRITNEVVIRVKDNGAGVPTEVKARIFEPFFTTKDVGVGTGVGLAFSHRIITSHGGTLVLQSVPGNGATFIIRLKAVAPASDTIAVTCEKPAVQGGKRILIVDDEVGVTQMIRDILETEHYDVSVEHDPRSALKLLKTREFDGILSDMKMPGLDGRVFFKRACDTNPIHARRFAFITGDTMSSEVAEFFESTGVPYLEKPVSPNELITLVELLCEDSLEPVP